VYLKIESHYEELIELDIINIKYDIVLEIDWLQKYNPIIDWKTKTLTFPECSRGQRSRKPRSTLFAKAIWVRPAERALAGISVELPEEYLNYEDLFKEREKAAALLEHKL
jgi:hypothetical protein